VLTEVSLLKLSIVFHDRAESTGNPQPTTSLRKILNCIHTTHYILVEARLEMCLYSSTLSHTKMSHTRANRCTSKKSNLRRLPNAFLNLDRDRDDQYRLHRGEFPLTHTASMSNADGIVTRLLRLYKLRPQPRLLSTRLSILCILRELLSLR
jgi:hypothetical protein